MKIIALALAALGSAPAPAPPQDTPQEEFELKLQYVKDDRIRAQASSKFAMDISMKFDFGGQANTVKMGLEMDSQVDYTTQILAVTGKNLVERELREYTKARATTKAVQGVGDEEKELPLQKQTLPYEGHTFEIALEEGGAKVTPKGADRKEVPEWMYRMFRSHEGVDKLLPEGKVQKGDRWIVDVAKLKAWAGDQMQGLKVKDMTGGLECTLKEIQTEGKTRTARVEFQMDLEARMEMAGVLGEEPQEDPAVRKTALALKICKGKGEFLFDVDEGTSISMEFQAPMDIEVNQSLGDNELTHKGKGVLEVQNRWKLEERKRP